MTNYYYSDASGQKQGPVGDEQLQKLVTQGIITPKTSLETEGGHKGLAGQIPGLFAPSPFIQSTTSISSVFCTNCGKSVTENAVACMSCGARPTGHKNFCRACGVDVNPQQIICVKCGASLENVKPGSAGYGNASAGDDASNSGPMWMHLTWPFVPIVTLIIWIVIQAKHPQANVHGKNILNAFFTAFINNFIYCILMIAFCCIPVGFAIVEIDRDRSPFTSMVILTGIPCGLFILFSIYILTVRPIISAIQNAIAAGKGEVRPYKWATRFFKT